MNLKNLFITLVAGLLAIGLLGLTIDDLKQEIDRAIVSETEAAQESRLSLLFEQFITAEHPLNQIEEAAGIWQELYPQSYQNWLELQTSDPAANLKLFYLWFQTQDDAISKINAGRQLAQNFEDQVYGYRLMCLTYLQHFPLEYYFDDPDEIVQMLESDQRYFHEYFLMFPQDEYHRLAGIYALNKAGLIQEACTVLSQAFEAEDPWLEQIDPDRIEPLADYHELLYYLAGLIADAGFPQKYAYLYTLLSSQLTSYYFEEEPDYERVVSLLDVPLEGVTQYYYDRYALLVSLYKTGRTQKAGDMLLQSDDSFDPIEFQNLWMMYELEQTTDIYQASLVNRTEPLARFLYARTIPNQAQIVMAGRQLVSELPLSEYGYRLLSDIYWQFFAQSKTDDPDWDSWVEMLATDTIKLKAAQIRFSGESWALNSYLLTLLVSQKTELAKKYYQMLLEDDLMSDIVHEADMIVAKTSKLDFLWELMNLKIEKYVEHELVAAEDQQIVTALVYCYTLYENKNYKELIEAVYAHPDWMENEDIQYMAVNSHYELNEYEETIDILRMMVERGTISMYELFELAELPVGKHPNWQALIDYATELNPDESSEAAETQDFEIRPAADWSLSDAEGNLVSLADQRGSIVILDFWATWCSPCQKSMPLIDEWMKEEMPQNVKVYSINVFEENRSAAIKFMNTNNYQMHLLFGDDELAEAYGVQGIPYICIIDPEGNIRNEELGFSPYLKDKLSAWVAEIQN